MFGFNDWTEYCLAHLFTYQSFEGSVLGLAYVGTNENHLLGGICSRSSYRQKRKFSVNIGISSYKSSNEAQGRLLQKEAQLVTAHGLENIYYKLI